MSSTLITLIVMAAIAAVGYGVQYIPGWKQDNVVEEACEEVIKTETGVDVDLTPQSPEEKKE